jgi:hypothetical protein
MSIRRLLCVMAATWLAVVADAAPAKLNRPIPGVEHVVLVSVDGLRPDLALRANMPALRGMLASGAFTFWAKTTEVSITLPSHTSMITGVAPEKHGVSWNGDLPAGQQRYPKFPTVLETATAAGYSTAMIVGKSKFATLDKPGTVAYSYVPSPQQGWVSISIVTTHAEEIIGAHKPVLSFIHLPEVDLVGHAKGWGSDAQIETIEKADASLARIFRALDEAGIRKSTVVILTADHGGAGFTHGPDDARSRHIPWIIVGPGVKHGYDLTRVAKLQVRTEDSAATILYLLGLPRPSDLDGRPVTAAFDQGSD